MSVRGTARYADLTLVPDGDGFIIGSAHAADFLAVPQIGGLVVRWLQEGHDVDECAAMAECYAGQSVDVTGLLDRLSAEGLLPSASGTEAFRSASTVAARRSGQPRGQRLGRLLYGPAGLGLQLGLATLWTLLEMSIGAVALHGVSSPLGMAGALAVGLVVIPTTFVLFGAIRSAARGLRTVLRPSRKA